MKIFYGLCIISHFLFFINVVIGVNVVILQQNVGGSHGDKVMLNCTVSAMNVTEAMEWYNHSSARIYRENYEEPPPGSGLTVDDEKTGSNGIYTLIANSLESKHAGQYKCRASLGGVDAYGTISVSGRLSCPAASVVSANTNITLECTVETFYRNASLAWNHGSMGELQTEILHSRLAGDALYNRGIANFTVTKEMDNIEFACVMEFLSRNGDIPPVYNQSCTTSLRVKHAVSNETMSISPNPDNYPDNIIIVNTGDYVNCTSKGYPEPSIFWRNKMTGDETQSWQLLVSNSMTGYQNYYCISSNIVDGITYSANISVELLVNSSPTFRTSIFIYCLMLCLSLICFY